MKKSSPFLSSIPRRPAPHSSDCDYQSCWSSRSPCHCRHSSCHTEHRATRIHRKSNMLSAVLYHQGQTHPAPVFHLRPCYLKQITRSARNALDAWFNLDQTNSARFAFRRFRRLKSLNFNTLPTFRCDYIRKRKGARAFSG